MTQPQPKTSEYLYEMASRMRGRADVWKQIQDRARKRAEEYRQSEAYGLNPARKAELWDEFWSACNRKMWCLLAAGRLNDAASRVWMTESHKRWADADAVLPDAP